MKKQNVFTIAADDAMKVIEFYEARQRVVTEFVEEMKKMHVYLLGIGRLGLSMHDEQKLQQLRALEYTNQRVMDYFSKHYDLFSTEGYVTGQFAKSMFEVHAHVGKNGWPVGRDQTSGD